MRKKAQNTIPDINPDLNSPSNLWPEVFQFDRVRLSIGCGVKEYNTFFEEVFLPWLENDPMSEENKLQVSDSVLSIDDYLILAKLLKWAETDISQPNEITTKTTTGSKKNQFIRSKVLNHTRILKVYNYLMSLVPKYLQTHDPTLISFIFNDNQILNCYSKHLSYKNDLIPFTSLSNITKLIHEKKGVRGWKILPSSFANLLDFAMRIITDTYFQGNDPNNSTQPTKVLTRDDVQDDFTQRTDIILPTKLTAEFVRGVIHIVMADDMEKAQDSKVEKLIFWLCLLTFQNLTESDIQSLKDDYISLLPFIFKYNKTRKLVTLGELKKKLDRSQKGQTNLYYLRKYYGNVLIEKESYKIYKEWTKKSISTPGYMFSVLGLLNCLEESPKIESNIQDIYEVLVEGFKISNLELQNQISHTLSMLIDRYGQFNGTHHKNIYEMMVVEKSIFTKPFNPKQMENYQLFVSLMTSKPKFALENINSIVGNKNFTTYLNQILVHPDIDREIRKSKNYKTIHQLLVTHSKSSPENNIYLLEYLMAHEDKQSLVSMARFLTKIINSKNQSVTRDAHFYDTLLKYYQLISNNQQHFDIFEKTVRSFTKTLESETSLNLEMIYPYVRTKKEVTYLMHQIKELLKEPSKYIRLCKYFLDFGDEDYTQLIIKNLGKKVRAELNKPSIPQVMEIMIGLKNYINIDALIGQNLTSIAIVSLNYYKNYYEYKRAFNRGDYNRYKSLSEQLKIFINLISGILDIETYYIQWFNELIKLDSERQFKITENSQWSIFNSIHTKLFGLYHSDGLKLINYKTPFDQPIEPIHQYITSHFIQSYNLTLSKLSFEQLKMVYIWFKPLQTLPSPETTNKILEQFKLLKDQIKRLLLKFIKQEEIKPLDFLFDSKLTGFSFNLDIQEQDFSSSTPQVQNLLVQKVLRYLYQDEHVQKEEYLEMALTSKVFFNETCKIFKNIPVRFDNAVSRFKISKWSFFQGSLYHLKYSQLSRFHYDDMENVFLQLSSLNLDTNNFLYLVKQEMKNLKSLTVKFNGYGNKINFLSLLNLLQFSPNLEHFELNLSNRYVKPLKEITQVINEISNLHNLEQVKIRYTVDKFKSPAKSAEILPILKRLEEIEKATNIDNNGRKLIIKTYIKHSLQRYNNNFIVSTDFKDYYSYCFGLIIGHCYIQNLNFINPFPKLQKLKILDHYDDRTLTTLFENSSVQSQVTSLLLPVSYFTTIGPMIILFTKLRKLTCPIYTHPYDTELNELFKVANTHPTLKFIKLIPKFSPNDTPYPREKSECNINMTNINTGDFISEYQSPLFIRYK
ncbi:hypothetical protein DLAC_05267 [Tieghemostelium lacteum]|uniref:Uncharacterized protein n=1 Tax=Tieghemostelium lacteum TaxID=361077 RepID=A0A151ZIX8_TIELA|nr:hypothetical protein DLAC_05267 [Tieghemostelium lacteum]|eukprot:KYQ93867.1 hypothetical protein DLAC_05267 [Tieghemostelium lacteum]